MNKFKQLTTDVELKRRQLVVLSLDASRVDAVQQLKGYYPVKRLAFVKVWFFNAENLCPVVFF